MEKLIYINDKIFKRYKDTSYYCDEDGNIYSNISRRLLNPMTRNCCGKLYKYIDIKGRHVNIHRIVYETWIGEITDNLFVLHKDDDSLNNNINNLYLGTQKDNIQDCINNNHRASGYWILTIFDKKENITKTFCPASDFIKYSGHPCGNKGVSRMFTRNWFKKRYEIISFYRCKNLSELRSVTTKGDECSPVG